MARGLASGAARLNDEISALARKIRVSATPAIFFSDGSRISGAIDAKGMEAKFKTIK